LEDLSSINTVGEVESINANSISLYEPKVKRIFWVLASLKEVGLAVGCKARYLILRGPSLIAGILCISKVNAEMLLHTLLNQEPYDRSR
jgi:hypothetical protein